MRSPRSWPTGCHRKATTIPVRIDEWRRCPYAASTRSRRRADVGCWSRHPGRLDIWASPPLDARGLFDEERRDLLTPLDSLSTSEWSAASSAEGWTVKDLALHLLDGDLGRLSRGRDGELTGVIEARGTQGLAEALAAKNQRWLEPTRQLGPPVIQDLLRFSTHDVDAWTADADLLGQAHVSWASDEPVPTWLDHAREFTETWVHHY
jgi:hypothetical protein